MVLWGVLKRKMLLLLMLASCAAGASSDPDSDPGSDPALETCVACSCASVENILYVNCEDLTTYRPALLRPPTSSLYHLNFQNNLLGVLYPRSFFNFTHAVSLHLGNNKLQSIEGGAFLGLGALKQLHLNNNELKALRSDTFLGSESLEYIQADYNLIRLIERGTFGKLHKLKVLILNDNLVQSLPENVFRFASLTHLDIRGNRIQTLPYIGVLEHIGRVVELQLDDNPWKCTCDLLPLKAWLENMPYDIFIGEAICETPIDLYGRLLKETNKAELCPAGTDSDFDVQMPPPQPGNGHAATNVDPAATPRLITKEPQPTASSKISGIVSGKAFPGTQNLSQLVPSQTGVPSVSPCPLPCTCKAHPSDFGISLSCQERNIENLLDLAPMPPNARKLHLSGNCIKIIAPNDFHAFQGLDFLHLGSNQIVTVQKGVFSNLTNLRRLYLNGNQLELLHPQMFLGLTSLQYLYLEYNAIKEVLAGTFDPMPNLQLLYLNNNVLRSLPAYIFSGLSVARLNLKNNHFRYLPVSGVLDQLRYLTQIDLEGNPWDCTCDLVALKLWLEKLNGGVAAEEVKCASPVQFSNIELRLLKNEILCPKLIAKPPLVLSEPTPMATSTSPADGDQGPPGESIPFSIIILSILVVLILTVSVAFCFLLFVLKCTKKPASRHAELGNQECGSLQLHLGRQDHQCCRKDSLDGDTFNPQTIQNICSSHTCGLRDFDLTCSDSLFLSNSADRDIDTLDPRKAALGGIEEIDEFLPGNMFFQNFLKSKDYSNMGIGDFDIQYPEKSQNKTKKRSLIPGKPSKASEDQRRREYFELKAKLQGSPDYLQVLEEQTALSRM